MARRPNGWHRKHGTPADATRQAKYNAPTHRQARAYYAAEIAAGRGFCWRCGGAIPPDTPGRAWHVGHDDDEPTIIRGAEHSLCNLKAAGRKGARIVNASRRVTRLTW